MNSSTKLREEEQNTLFSSLYTEGKVLVDKISGGRASHDEKLRLLEIDIDIFDLVQERLTNASSDILIDTSSKADGSIYWEDKLYEEYFHDSNARKYWNDNASEDQANTYAIDKLIEHHPGLKDFSVTDAVGSVNGDSRVEDKFPLISPEMLSAVSIVFLRENADKYQVDFPAAYNRLYTEPSLKKEKIDVDTPLSVSDIFNKVSRPNAFQNNELDRRIEIIDSIAKDTALLTAIEKIKSPINIKDLDEQIDQIQATETVAERISDIYAQHYQLKQFNGDDFKVVLTSMQAFTFDGMPRAQAVQGLSGISGDEHVAMFSGPMVDLALARERQSLDDDAYRRMVVSTVVEELQHTVDNIYVDDLVNGNLSYGEDEFEHASWILLNKQAYQSFQDGVALYESQYLERIPKEIAMDVSDEVIFRMNNKDIPKQDELSSDINGQSIINPQM